MKTLNKSCYLGACKYAIITRIKYCNGYFVSFLVPGDQEPSISTYSRSQKLRGVLRLLSFLFFLSTGTITCDPYARECKFGILTKKKTQEKSLGCVLTK